ncbi:hypothetical protein GCM10011352_25600 [Marinobacterium zhoushanense]|uniref:Uncharacterized protein n=1 Tax=Marinobacterium zhoushanense TaxID=1679163 RepID=A0ABQ1KH93_9GAMM|nr:hypothetical protein GCM10011352_25600 [Marinobacterium zhoushanense]
MLALMGWIILEPEHYIGTESLASSEQQFKFFIIETKVTPGVLLKDIRKVSWSACSVIKMLAGWALT